MTENNKNQNQNQRTPQSNDMNKPQKPISTGEKPGQQSTVSGDAGVQDKNKNVKNPSQGGKADIDQPGMGGVGGKQTSSNANKMDTDLDDDKATQRTPRPNLDRDVQK